ncbi:bifunctional diguanylate cyclase/phosphodiesterase [Rheinheimera sp.]|uniref:putative bifunctional diguanylate cyclase/phosphodiesterase n=1 Tax=Rheinheimera sp. TaxID=1869214 RepID=UPI0027B9102F|nr:EAL domain-containing protein [Rheinheimera sp.]
MRPFLSLPWKILVLTLGALLLMTVVLTSFSLVKMEQDFRLQQNKQLELRQQQFNHLNLLLENQLRSWIESFTDMVLLRTQPDFATFATKLAEHYDAISLHLNVESMWLLDAKLQPLYASVAEIPKPVLTVARQVLALQQPQSAIFCRLQCTKLVMVPVQNASGELAVVAISTTLLDVLASLKQGVGSEVAIVRIESANQSPLFNFKLLSLSNPELMRPVFAELSEALSLQQAITAGIDVELNQQQYLISLLPLLTQDEGFYLALVDDISKFALAKQQYQQQIIWFACVSFFLLALLIYISTLRLSRRLLNLAAQLPLLAQRQFRQFRQQSSHAPLLFQDEVDVLTQSAHQLSVELEHLHQQIEVNTQELENIAMFDLLTGLPNRNMLQFQLKKCLAALERQDGALSVLFLDLDDFKKINDSKGHAAGDQLLVEAASRLRSCIRSADIACRFGGDEFVLVLTQSNELNYPYQVADRIFEAFKQPISLGNQLFYISTSIGISITEDPDAVPDELIRQADMAMYEAKERGGNNALLYDQQMYQRLAQRLVLEREIKDAISQQQFSLSLQPQIELATGRLSGFEALLRWQHPQRGIVTPDEFISILENSPQMIELGYWVFKRSFFLAKELINKGYPDIRIAINLSAEQFLDPALPDLLALWLEDLNLSAAHFELELTERTLVKNIDATLTAMRALKAQGFYFAIDDFGTGYSSLSYLKQMPVDIIKIDKSFVFGMLENDADYQIIVSTIAMVQKLELKVVAEGVENRAQLQLLRQHRCDYAQGYYFARPLNDVQLQEFLTDKVPNGYLMLG